MSAGTYPLRVLQMLPGSNILGGIETSIMSYYSHIDRDRVQYDFVFHYDEPTPIDEGILELGGTITKYTVRQDFNTRRYRAQLGELLASHPEYRIMHGHMPGMAPVYFDVARRAGVPHRLAHSHVTTTEPTPKGFVLRQVIRRIKYVANEYLACSTEAGRFMFGKRPFKLVKNAIDVNRFRYDEHLRAQTRAALGADELTFVMGHVGRLNPQKNHTYLLDVFARVHETLPNSKLVLVGDGPLEDELRAKAKGLGLSDDVVFYGVAKDVAGLYCAMDVFVLPSLFEGLPNVLIEAQSCGLPCLVGDQVSRESRITDLVEFLSIDADPSVWATKALATRARQRSWQAEKVREAGFDINQEARNIEKYYLSLVGM